MSWNVFPVKGGIKPVEEAARQWTTPSVRHILSLSLLDNAIRFTAECLTRRMSRFVLVFVLKWVCVLLSAIICFSLNKFKPFESK